MLEELERVQPGLDDLILGHVYGTAAVADTAEPTAVAALTETDFSAILPAVRAPTLVVWGEADLVTPLRTGHVLARRIPRASLAVLDGVGHAPMVEDPGRFNALLLGHLQGGDRVVGRRARAGAASDPEQPLPRGTCRGKRGMVFEGDYQGIDIRNCADVTLRNVRARQVAIVESRVDILDSDIRGDAVALDVEGSDVRITATGIHGETAIRAARSRLDLAGVELVGRRDALVSRGGVKAIFSVSEAEGAAGRRDLHGYFALSDGQGL